MNYADSNSYSSFSQSVTHPPKAQNGFTKVLQQAIISEVNPDFSINHWFIQILPYLRLTVEGTFYCFPGSVFSWSVIIADVLWNPGFAVHDARYLIVGLSHLCPFGVCISLKPLGTLPRSEN
jgi:hypothetical protein